MNETNNETKTFEEPVVTKIEFDFNDTVVTAFSGVCTVQEGLLLIEEAPLCYD